MATELDDKTRASGKRIDLWALWPIGILLSRILPWVGAVSMATLFVINITSNDPPAPPATENERFGVPLATRREIFTTYLASMKNFRKKASRFPDAWSQQDDVMYHIHVHTLNMAAEYGLHYSQVYLIFDEGVRQQWRTETLPPIPATNPPLRPRTR